MKRISRFIPEGIVKAYRDLLPTEIPDLATKNIANVIGSNVISPSPSDYSASQV
jgi:hypothetical protein